MPTPLALPQPLSLPASQALTNPTFGQNPYGGPNMYLASSFQQNTQAILASRSTTQQQLFSGAQFAAMNNQLGGALGSDPRTWTPEDAAQQTDRALAKLSTVNPELATQLAQQRSGSEDQSGSGFWGDLLHVAGEVLHPALSLGGEILDIIGRTAHVVPNIAFDLADGGGFSLGGDVGGALTGHMNHNWNSVFQQMGWTGGGLGGVLRAGLGLIGDVATDPLTYLMPVPGGTKLAEAAGIKGAEFAGAKGAELAAERGIGESLAAKLPGEGGLDQRLTGYLKGLFDPTSTDETMKVLNQAIKDGKQGSADILERLGGGTYAAFSAEEQKVVQQAFEAYSRAYNIIDTRGLRALGSQARRGLLLSDGTDISAQSLKDFLEQQVKAGAGKGWKDPAWKSAEEAARAAGGLRFHAILPFTAFRYVGPSMELGRLGKFLPGQGLAVADRFFAGHAGLTSLMHNIASGEGDATWEHMQYWMANGWSAFREKFPEVADTVRGRGKQFGSPFYSASEHVGRLTAHFDSQANMARRGLVGYYAHRTTLQANTAANNLVRDSIARALNDEDNKGFVDDLQKVWGLSAKEKLDTATDEQKLLTAKWLDYFPASADTSTDEGVAAFFAGTARGRELDALTQKAQDGGLMLSDERRATQLQDQLKDMQGVARQVRETQGGEEILRKYAKVQDIVREELAKHDIAVGNVKMGFHEAMGIPQQQLDEWRVGAGLNHPITQANNGVYYLHRTEQTGTDAAEAADLGINESLKTAGEDGWGYTVHSTPQSPEDIAVGLRGDFIEFDQNGNASLLHEGEQSSVQEERARVREVIDQSNQQQAVAAPVPEATPASSGADLVRSTRSDDFGADATGHARIDVTDDGLDIKEAQGLTESLQKHYDGKVGSFRRNADGSITATVWNKDAIIRTGDHYMHVGEERGFFHRSLNETFAKWLNGTLKSLDDSGAVMLSVPQMQAKLSRETIGMTFQEASDHVKTAFYRELIAPLEEGPLKQKLLKTFGELPDHAWDTDILGVHAKYLNDSANAVRARILGRAAQGQLRVSALAPDIFAASPRGPVYQWQLDEKGLALLKGKDKQLVSAVMNMHRKGAVYMNRMHKYHAALASDFGTFSMLVDNALDSGDFRPLTREGEAWMRHGARLDEAKGAVESARQTTQAAIDSVVGQKNEAARLREETIAAIDAARPEGPLTPEELAARGFTGAEQVVIDNGDGTHTVLGYHYSARGLPSGPDPGTAGFSSGRMTHQGGYGAAGDRGSSLGGEAAPAAEVVAERTQPVEFRGRLLLDADGVPLTVTDAEAHLIGQAAAGEIYGVHLDESGTFRRLGTFEEVKDARTKPGKVFLTQDLQGYDGVLYKNSIEGIKGYGGAPDLKRLEQEWRNLSEQADEAQRVAEGTPSAATKKAAAEADRKATAAYGKYIDAQDAVEKAGGENALKDTSLGVFEHSQAETQHVVARPGSAELFDEMRNKGELYHNQNTGSVLRKNTVDFVKQGGGRRIKSADQLDAAEQELREKMTQLDTWAADLEAGFSPVPNPAAKGIEGKVQGAARSKGVAFKAHAKSEREVAAAATLVESARVKMAEAQTAVNKSIAEFKQVKARVRPALVPIKTAGALEGLQAMRIPGLEGYAMPDFIAEEWHRIYDMRGPGYLSKEWRKWVLGPWKRWATYRWPGFHVRNFFGAWFNNWLGGVNVGHYGFSWKVMREGYQEAKVSDQHFDQYLLKGVFGSQAKGELTYGDVRNFLARIGIGESNSRSVLEAADTVDALRTGMEDLARNGASVKDKALSPFRVADAKLRDVGGNVEGFHRIAAFAAGMQATGGDAWGARAFVMLRHGDYADLTKVEDHVRDLIPFYKWMRTNTPYQLRMLAEQPAKVSLFSDKLKGTAYDIAGYDRGNAELGVPGYIQEDFAVPIPDWVPVFGSKGPDAIKYAMFNLPYSDLYNGLNDYMSSALPIVRNVAESWGFKKDAFTGADLGTGKMVKLSGAFGNPAVGKLLDMVTPFVHAGPDGSYYVSDQVEHVLTAWPVYSRFRNWVEADPKRVENRLSGVLSGIAGVGVAPADFTAAELDFYYNEVEPVLQSYRDMGVVFPNAQDFVTASNAVIGQPAATLPGSLSSGALTRAA